LELHHSAARDHHAPLVASRELIGRLIKAGHLPPALPHDADTVRAAIARLKQDLRNGHGDDESRTAA
jgi:hypothetical protein